MPTLGQLPTQHSALERILHMALDRFSTGIRLVLGTVVQAVN